MAAIDRHPRARAHTHTSEHTVDIPSGETRHFLLLAEVSLTVGALLVALNILDELIRCLPPKNLDDTRAPSLSSWSVHRTNRYTEQ